MTVIAESPKRKFIHCALRLFAERGYFGVSLADVAGELGLTKQSIIYHFKTKDALYGAVIADIAQRLEATIDDVSAQAPDARARLEAYLRKLGQHMLDHPRDARLITRELLDNLDRAQADNTWYMRRFLDQSVAIIAAHPNWTSKTPAAQAAITYQLIGAVCYFSISDPTLNAIWGRARVSEMTEVFVPSLLDLVEGQKREHLPTK